MRESDIDYSFDGDWGNDAVLGGVAPYDYYTQLRAAAAHAERGPASHQRSTAEDDGFGWVAGLYALRWRRTGCSATSSRASPAHAAFKQLRRDQRCGLRRSGVARAASMTLSAGLRAETRAADYADSDGAAFTPTIRCWVGISRSAASPAGRRAGTSPPAAATRPEASTSDSSCRKTDGPCTRVPVEPRGGTALRCAGCALDGQLAVFHMWRDDQQVATSFQVDPGDPLSYIFLTDNAASGRTVSRAELPGEPVDRLALAGTLGLLHTEYIDYRYGDRDLDGREQAHAPGWQYSLTAKWLGPRDSAHGPTWRAPTAFYFDSSHDQRSRPARSSILKAGWSGRSWAAWLWGRNVFDETTPCAVSTSGSSRPSSRTSSTCSAAIRVRSA